jgi:hypothetical protein
VPRNRNMSEPTSIDLSVVRAAGGLPSSGQGVLETNKKICNSPLSSLPLTHCSRLSKTLTFETLLPLLVLLAELDLASSLTPAMKTIQKANWEGLFNPALNRSSGTEVALE